MKKRFWKRVTTVGVVVAAVAGVVAILGQLMKMSEWAWKTVADDF